MLEQLATTPAVPATPAVEVPPVVPVLAPAVAAPAQLEPPENPELVAMRERLASLEAQLSTSRVNAAAKTATAAPKQLNTRQADMLRDSAIRSCGGVARWYGLQPNQRLSALGCSAPTVEELAELGTYFGPKSTPHLANALGKNEPMKYLRLRTIARELQLA